MQQISPTQCLPVGTPVKVGNQKGTVQKAIVTCATNGGDVALHTIKFSHTFKRGFGQQGKWVEIKPVTRVVNYSFIQPL